ncbi:MAG: DUF1543 domain-containing protein, partial [Parvularculaceae bacterium]|nr:DUF1543 domain-containing protein [Parvularculaceae bacterium]
RGRRVGLAGAGRGEAVKKRLFVVIVGGSVPGAHVELHDVRFVIGRTIDDCLDDLRAQWWGAPESLHLDAWGPLDWADGYRVEIADAPAAGEEKLWFFNLGGYDPARFDELHANLFVVDRDWRSAKKRALEKAAGAWTSPHKDYVFDVDAAVDVGAAAQGHVRLVPDAEEIPFAFEARYVPIGKLKV